MTCIVGIADGKKVWMGTDTLWSNYCTEFSVSGIKAWKHHNMIIAYCADGRAPQVLQYSSELPTWPGDYDPHTWLIREWIPAVIANLKANGAASVDNERVTMKAEFIIGLNGRVFSVSGNFQVLEMQHEFFADGSGQDVALGSLHTTSHYEIKPRERLRLALEAAQEFSVGVRGPFQFIEV